MSGWGRGRFVAWGSCGMFGGDWRSAGRGEVRKSWGKRRLLGQLLAALLPLRQSFSNWDRHEFECLGSD